MDVIDVFVSVDVVIVHGTSKGKDCIDVHKTERVLGMLNEEDNATPIRNTLKLKVEDFVLLLYRLAVSTFVLEDVIREGKVDVAIFLNRLKDGRGVYVCVSGLNGLQRQGVVNVLY